MAVPNSTFQNVTLYEKSQLGYLCNLSALFLTENRLLNTEFQYFNRDFRGNLGDTISFERKLRSRSQNSLIANEQGIEQLKQTLSVVNQISADFTYDDPSTIFNIQPGDILPESERSRLAEMATNLETYIYTEFSADAVVFNANSANNGQLVNPASGPYRFFANGWAPGQASIPVWNNITQLSKAQVAFKNYGYAPENPVIIMPDISQPDIVASALNQFVMNRNEDWGNTYQVGAYAGFKVFISSLLNTHISGNVGNSGSILTVVSTNETNGVITEITFSGANPNDPNAIRISDKFQFYMTNGFRFLRYVGHDLTILPVQVRSTANVTSTAGGLVTVPIFPALNFNTSDQAQNIPFNILAGLQAGVLPDHMAGIVMSGNPLFWANPRLNDKSPWTTRMITPNLDGEDLAVLELRHYYGSQQIGVNKNSSILDGIWGTTLVPENCMMLAFPPIGNIYT